MNTEIRRINTPPGATIRVTRKDGTHEIYVQRGADSRGAIFEDVDGNRHSDIGEYIELAVKSEDGWTTI